MISEVKERITITQLGRELYPDWVPARSCRSPFRPDQSPSFSVYNDGKLFMDFATGDKGDVIDFYALAKGVSGPEALNALWDRMRGSSKNCESAWSFETAKKGTERDPFALPYTPSPAEHRRMGADCERLLHAPEAILAMAKARSWDQAILRELALEGVLGLSREGCVTFNYLSGSKSRWLDGQGKRQIRWNFGKPWFWRGDLILADRRIWIVEGETKCITALCWGWERGKRIIAIPSASFNPAPWAYLFRAKEVTYVADPDSAGIAAAARVEVALRPLAKSMIVLYPQDLTGEKR